MLEEKQRRTRKKNTTLSSDDISVDRKAVTKIIMVNTEKPNVIKIDVSMFVIPNQQRDKEEYEEQIERIVKASNKLLRKYVNDNRELFDRKYIVDINFTSANLRKGYNKSVQMTLFVKQNIGNKMSILKKSIKSTIKDTVNSITSIIREEDFKCYKTKQTLNKNVS